MNTNLFQYNHIKSPHDLNKEQDNFNTLFQKVVALCSEPMQEYEKEGWLIRFHKSFGHQPMPAIAATKQGLSITVSRGVNPGANINVVFDKGDSQAPVTSAPAGIPTDFDVFQQLWWGILQDAEKGLQHFTELHQEVSVAQITDWLQMPVIADAESAQIDSAITVVDTWKGFWEKDFMYFFRRHNVNTNEPAILQIGQQVQTNSGFDVRSYRFIVNAVQQPSGFSLKYNSSQNEKVEDRYNDFQGVAVFPFDWAMYKEALDWYRLAHKNIAGVNETYTKLNSELERKNKPYEAWTGAELYNTLVDKAETYNTGIFESDYLQNQLKAMWIDADDQPVWHCKFKVRISGSADTTLCFRQEEAGSNGKEQPIRVLEIENENKGVLQYRWSGWRLLEIRYITTAQGQKASETQQLSALTDKPILILAIHSITHLYEFIIQQDDALEQEKNAALQVKQFVKPFDHMMFQGTRFRLIDLHEANRFIADLTDLQGDKLYDVYGDTWRFPHYNENAFFLLAEEDVVMEKLELEYNTDTHPDIFILGFIFKQNLVVQKFLCAFDTDNSPALIVLGKLVAQNIKLFGNIHYVGAGLRCENIWGVYNHGGLYVKGKTVAAFVYADDMQMYFELFEVLGAAYNTRRPDIATLAKVTEADGTITPHIQWLPSTHKLSQLVKDIYVTTHSTGVEELNEEAVDNADSVMANGGTLVDVDKKHWFLYEHFTVELDDVFDRLTALPGLNEKKVIYAGNQAESYIVQLMEWQGEPLIQLTVLPKNIPQRFRAYRNQQNRHSTLLMEYLDEKGEVIYRFEDGPDAFTIEMNAVKVVIQRAADVLLHEVESPQRG